MKGLAALAVLLMLGGCDGVTRATPAPTGQSSVNGGGAAYLGNTPRGETNFPYR